MRLWQHQSPLRGTHSRTLSKRESPGNLVATHWLAWRLKPVLYAVIAPVSSCLCADCARGLAERPPELEGFCSILQARVMGHALNAESCTNTNFCVKRALRFLKNSEWSATLTDKDGGFILARKRDIQDAHLAILDGDP